MTEQTADNNNQTKIWAANISYQCFQTKRILCLMCAPVKCVARCDDHTILCETWTLVSQWSRRIWSESNVVEDVCREKGCVTGLVPETLSQPLPTFEPAETPQEGHDTHCSLSLHQAFHMSQPSLTSPPGWRKKRKRMLYCFSLCFTSPRVRLCFSFTVFVVCG